MHKFNSIFNTNSNKTNMELNKFHECEYNIINENLKEINMYNIILKLKDEINIINNQINLICDKNIEKDVKNYKFILDNLKLFSKELLELIRYNYN